MWITVKQSELIFPDVYGIIWYPSTGIEKYSILKKYFVTICMQNAFAYAVGMKDALDLHQSAAYIASPRLRSNQLLQ